jgi:hypothetical protein
LENGRTVLPFKAGRDIARDMPDFPALDLDREPVLFFKR